MTASALSPRAASIELLIVDLDGTLVDSFADIRRSLTAALTELSVEPTEEVLELSRRGAPLEVYYRRAFDRDPLASEESARFARFVAAYRQSYFAAHTAAAYPGVVDTLTELRRRRPGRVMAVGTSKRTDMAKKVIELAGLSEHFDLVQGSEDVAKKPNPALLRLISERVKIPLDRAMMVGDTSADVLAAKAAGCLAIAVTYGGLRRDELSDLGADALIDRFSELLDLLG